MAIKTTYAVAGRGEKLRDFLTIFTAKGSAWTHLIYRELPLRAANLLAARVDLTSKRSLRLALKKGRIDGGLRAQRSGLKAYRELCEWVGLNFDAKKCCGVEQEKVPKLGRKLTKRD